jgi:chloramphenicol-sensitive protein RarD
MPERASTAASGQTAAGRIADPGASCAAATGPPVSGAIASALAAGANVPNASVAPSNAAPSDATAATPQSGLSTKGLLAAAASFVIWGALPLYLRPIHELPSFQIIAHRIAWACVLVLIWLAVRGDLGDLRKLFSDRKILGRLVLSAILITINWTAYVWAVGHGRVLEASLGYFINPLANVLLGVVFLRERLNVAQWTAVGIAAAAVLYISVAAGATPWIALSVATSFSLYGLIRKVIHVEALHGLAVETLVLMPFALGYLLWCESNGTGAFGHASAGVNALLVGCGAVTAVPLFLFAVGTRLIPYSTVGLLLYITPSLQLLCGIYLYHESFAGARALGFALIWLALLIYAGDGVWRAHRARAA